MQTFKLRVFFVTLKPASIFVKVSTSSYSVQAHAEADPDNLIGGDGHLLRGAWGLLLHQGRDIYGIEKQSSSPGTIRKKNFYICLHEPTFCH